MLETYVIYTSGECNCRCHYCYLKNNDKTAEKYSWENVKEYLDKIVEYNKHFNIEFLGGEPMLNSPLIEQVVEYLSSLENVKVNSFTITTNGTIIDDVLIRLLKKHSNLKWAASMDGTKWMNQLRVFENGINTYETVIENFKTLSQDFDRKQLHIHLVTHPYNIGFLHEGVKHLYSLGWRVMGIGTIESTIIIGREYCEAYIKELYKISDDIVAGVLPDLSVDVLNNLKPRKDVRHYVYDDNNNIIGETYGRTTEDITDKKDYQVQAVSSNLGDLIADIREDVYLYHQHNLSK